MKQEEVSALPVRLPAASPLHVGQDPRDQYGRFTVVTLVPELQTLQSQLLTTQLPSIAWPAVSFIGAERPQPSLSSLSASLSHHVCFSLFSCEESVAFTVLSVSRTLTHSLNCSLSTPSYSSGLEATLSGFNSIENTLKSTAGTFCLRRNMEVALQGSVLVQFANVGYDTRFCQSTVMTI